MSRFANAWDTLQNFVSGLGMPGIDPSASTQYVLNLLDRNALENMYRGDWLARKIIDAVADDCTREWRKWQANQDQIEALEEVEKTLDLQRKIKSWIIKARLYGGSALVIGVDDGNDPSQPIDLKKCGKDCLKYVVVLHRYELNAGPRLYNVSDPFYSRPAYFTIATPMFGFQGEPGSQYPDLPGAKRTTPPGALSGFWSNVVPFRGGRSEQQAARQQLATVPTNLGLTQIHPSRVLELPGNDLPDWRLAPLGGGWGDSVLQTVVDTMQDMTSTLRSVAAMVSDGKLDVVKIPDMALNLTTPGYKAKLIERFTLSAQTKSVISALLLDKEEEWQRVNTSYSGLPMIMHEFITIISGAANIPVTRLFGQAVGRGLSGGSTSGGGGGAESDLRNYYDDCASKQKNDLAPRLALLDEVLMRTALGKDDPNIHYEWNPLWQVSDEDKAKIALAKAQTTQIYATIGIINEDVLRQGLVNQLIEDGTYPGLDDAIEEFGAEPEEPEDTGGYLPPTGGGKPPPGGAGGETAQPNMEQQHSNRGGAAADFNPYHEPAGSSKGGEFASGPGGGGGDAGEGGGASAGARPQHPGPGYSPGATLDKHGVIQTTSVFDAQKALSEGREVELDQPRKISVLIHVLGEKAAEMIAKGDKAPGYNLCNVMIKGESLFCHENKDIPRIEMPQMNKKQTKEFRRYLQDKGYKVEKDEVRADHLRATQNEISGQKVAEVADKLVAKFGGDMPKRLVVSKDNYVLDGHHHWAAKMGLDYADGTLKGDQPIKVARVNVSITKLLKLAQKFTGGKGAKGTGDAFADLFDGFLDDDFWDDAGSAGARVEDELRDIKALLEDAPRPPIPPINVNITMPPSSRVKKTVTTHRDENGNLVAEVHEEDEE